MPIALTEDEFERLVGEELDALPAEMLDGLENVAFVIEDAAEGGEELFGRQLQLRTPDGLLVKVNELEPERYT